MAFTKYASYEQAQVLDLKGSPTRVHSASLSKLGEFEDYRTEDGYLYARIRAISSRVNKNHDGWPSEEIAGGPELFEKFTKAATGKTVLDKTASFTVEAETNAEYGYSTFLGKPIFVDHHNSNPERARGVIVDAKLHVDDHKTAALDPYYASDSVDDTHLPPTWVELLLEVDAKSFPRLAKAIIEGSKDPEKGIDGFSMGCDVEKSTCNICKNSATSPDEYCHHIRLKGHPFSMINTKTGKKESRKSYENCYGIKFFEISAVFDPADETALLREVRSSIHKEADELGDWQNDFQDARARSQEHMEPGEDLPGLAMRYMQGDQQAGVTIQNVTGMAPDAFIEGARKMMAPVDEGPHYGTRNKVEAGRKLSKMLKEAMTAKDFVMLADAIATGPFPNRKEIANHFARYLAQTNPNFDFERFVAAATGAPQSGRDQYSPAQEVPGQFPPGQDQGTLAKVAADSVAHPCPECGSHTTELFDEDGSSNCQNCGKLFKSDIKPNKLQGFEGTYDGGTFDPDIEDLAIDMCANDGQMWDNLPESSREHYRQQAADESSMALVNIPPPPNTVPQGWNRDPLQEHYDQPSGLGWDDPRNSKVAQNPPPQTELLHIPQEVDTLREEKVCPICGSTMDDENCAVCGYIEPPEGFDNPDLDKAKEEQQPGQQPGEDAFQDQDIPEGALGPSNEQPEDTSNLQPISHVTNDMGWKLSLPQRVAERTEVVPGNPPASDEPGEEVLEDSDQPITSHVRTAEDFIAAAGATRRNQMSQKTADAASGAPAVATPDKSVDTDGVGGVMDATNEEASRADAQIEVEGVGGTGVEGVGAESTESLPDNTGDAGFDTKKDIEQIPTKTFDDGSSGVERQNDPVSSEPFPASEDGVKNSAWTVEGLDDGPFPAHEDSAAPDGGTVQGVQPVDPVGVADDRVDLTQTTTTPANNSGPTKTWSGTDGNGVLRQQEPTTTETLEGEDGVKSAHIFTAFKLADLEVELGLLSAEKKYERVAALEAVSGDSLQAQLEYAQKVKTSGVTRKSRTAGRVPVLGRNASATESTEPSETEIEIPDEALFS